MKMFFAVLLVLSQLAYADDKVESYSHREILKLAKASVAVIEDVKNKSKNTTMDMLLNFSEFKGYVSSYLDFHQKGDGAEIIRACVAKKTTEEITINMAYLISESQPKRDISSSDRFSIFILTYCSVMMNAHE